MKSPNDSADRQFNKDFMFLQELQRLENLSNTYAIENNHPHRHRTLKRWKSAIIGIITEEQTKHLKNLIEMAEPVKYGTQHVYDPEALDELHDYLNILNVQTNLHLTVRKDDLLEPEAQW